MYRFRLERTCISYVCRYIAYLCVHVLCAHAHFACVAWLSVSLLYARTCMVAAAGLELHSGWLSGAELTKYSVALGQVGGVAVDVRGFVFVFHRGPVVWDGNRC